MSSFNWIIVHCPKCGEEIEFQSKSGTRLMKKYDINNVPPQELIGIIGEKKKCLNCNSKIQIEGKVNINKIDGRKYVELVD